MDALKLANKAPFEGAGLTRRQVAVLMALLASLAMSLLREELRSKRTQTWAQGVTYLTTVLYVVTCLSNLLPPSFKTSLDCPSIWAHLYPQSPPKVSSSIFEILLYLLSSSFTFKHKECKHATGHSDQCFRKMW